MHVNFIEAVIEILFHRISQFWVTLLIKTVDAHILLWTQLEFYMLLIVIILNWKQGNLSARYTMEYVTVSI